MIFDMTRRVASGGGLIGFQGDIIPTSGDVSGEYTITVDGLPDFFVVVAEADMTAQNAYLQSMYAIRDANNTGAAAPYSGIRGSSSALSYFGTNNTATINFTTNAIIVTFSPSLAKLKSGVAYRWFAWSAGAGGNS